MNLKAISKADLLASTEKLVAEERRIISQILWHLFEIERRRLFAELAGKIDSGELNVNALSQAQTLFRQVRMENKTFTLEAKRELVERLENKSQRECEKILADVSPLATRPSRERVLARSCTEIRFEADDALYAKIQTLKGKLAHRLKGSNDFADLLKLLVDDTLGENPSKRPPVLPPVEVQTKNSISRYIPTALRRALFEKAQNQCTYVDAITKRRCSSTFALEVEHCQPLALGGKTELSNLTILCRTHNQLAAIQRFGLAKMELYLNASPL